MSKPAYRDAVESRLAELKAAGHKTAAQVHHYVVSAHETRPSTRAFLTTIRLDPSLALELRSGMGRDVICALEDDRGVARYPMWTHSAPNAVQPGGEIRTFSIESYNSIKNTLDTRRPRVVLRDATELSEIPKEVDDWRRVDGPGELWGGP